MADITYDGKPIRHTMTDYGGSRVYIGYVDDCFDPPLILVLGDTFDDAFDNLMLHPIVRAATVINDPDLADYCPVDVWYNDEGEPCDTEAVQMFQIAGPPEH